MLGHYTPSNLPVAALLIGDILPLSSLVCGVAFRARVINPGNLHFLSSIGQEAVSASASGGENRPGGGYTVYSSRDRRQGASLLLLRQTASWQANGWSLNIGA